MSTFDDERRMQPYMDEFYKGNGYSVDRSKSCREYDCIISKDDKILRVEEKYLFTVVYRDMLIEILQDLDSADLGWFYHIDCEYIAWMYCGIDRETPPKNVYLISWRKLRKFTIERLSNTRWIKFNICPKNYGLTLNLPMEWDSLIAQDIATVYPYPAQCP